jgi:acyl-CoA synthetase (AMP-forming)/AMP-acid ligase II
MKMAKLVLRAHSCFSGKQHNYLVTDMNLLTIDRYVSDPERTKQALDEEGFFRTGDAVEIHGNKVFISGRIGLDCQS